MRIPPKASEPESGSVMAQDATFSMVMIPGSQRSFCASVPRDAIVVAPNPRLTPSAETSPMQAPASSLITTAIMESRPLRASPEPPAASPSARARSFASIFSTLSRDMASIPNSANSFRMIGYGVTSPLSRASRFGRISLAMKPRTASRIIRSVSDHSNIDVSSPRYRARRLDLQHVAAQCVVERPRGGGIAPNGRARQAHFRP